MFQLQLVPGIKRGQHFSLINYFRKAKKFAVLVGLSLIYQMVFPVISYALTSGPSSPDFSSFEPVATTNMVNEFSGQFVYNLPVLEIPGANGAGYALSLSYHSGDGPESESSWVGQGWTLNPGSINRSNRGLPDDYNGDTITYYNSVPKNWTIAATGNVGTEIFSTSKVPLIGLSANETVRYNNYKGFGFSTGAGLNALGGLVSLGMSVSEGDVTFSAAINPAAILTVISAASKKNGTEAGPTTTKQSNKLVFAGPGQCMRRSVQSFLSGGFSSASSSYISYMLTSMTSPYNNTPFVGMNVAGNVSVATDPDPAPVGASGGINISYSSQENISPRSVVAYGYMYLGNDTFNNKDGSHESMMDYTLENPSTFNERDKYLPIPFSTPDAYAVSGEGIGGSFRMYNDRIGIFSPNYSESNTTMDYFGVDVHVGDDVGIGGETYLDGGSTIRVKSDWSKGGNGNTDSFWFMPYDFRDTNHVVEEASSFRFNNDLGGKAFYDAASDKPVAAVIEHSVPMLDTNIGKLLQGANINKIPSSDDRRNARASYVGFHTIREINTKTNSNASKRGLAYEKTETVNDMAGRNNTTTQNALADQIGEIAVVNESGNQYVYGLPVYTVGSTSMQHGMTSVSGNNYIVNADISSNGVKIGEENSKPTASNYLLTQITTPDYVDVNQNGPDATDFGGYTRFAYKRVVGNANKRDTTGLYRWRAPYKGLYFKPNRLSDNTDNMGAYEMGFKEVYYLDTIDTKTHFAVFYTDTTADGIEAANVNDAATGSSGNLGSGAMHQKLTMIKLYAKQSNSTPVLIKTVRFEYSYESWPNSPNSGASHNGGKLTLKRVWFEYNGAVDAYISPYVFGYKYPTVPYPSQYAYIKTEMTGLTEGPDYDPYIDCWGNYQEGGSGRRDKLMSWRSQNPSSTFDPAAWQLKTITLPSGGQIHIQYEENTYSYVQNLPASALVHTTGTQPDANSFYIDAANDLGITSSSGRDSLITLINNTYKDQKIFFKFFYSLVGPISVNIGNCSGDYIEGYANFGSASYDGTGIKITLSGGSLPQTVCYDYARHQVGGKILEGSTCTPEESATMGDPFVGGGDFTDNLKALAMQLTNAAKMALGTGKYCLVYNNNLSYFRLPIVNKKGGGIRVKRLLMYDRGVDANSPGLYGTEYIYDNQSNGASYGVATNEPAENRGENPLVTYLAKRGDQDWKDKTIAGKDREQFEGPIGMNAYPSASVGYSRIIKKNIAQSKDVGTGFTVVEYYTAKDYPLNRLYATGMGVDFSSIQKTKDDWNVDIGVFSYTINTGLRTSQGYSFIQNQMHGQLKSITTYPGLYDPVKYYNTKFSPIPVSQTTYSYYEPGALIPMYNYDNYSISYDQPGKEMDITVDRRCVEEESSQTRLTADATVGLTPPPLGPIPYVIGFPVTSGTDQTLSTIVVNKVIHYPAIVKQISTMKDGFTQYTDNIAFDPITAKPVITRTYDGYDGLYLKDKPGSKHNGQYWTYNVMASSQYPLMGQRAWNENYCYYAKATDHIHVSGIAAPWTLQGVNIRGMFAIGDLVALFKTNGDINMVNVTAISGNDVSVRMARSLDSPSNLSSSQTTYYKAQIIHSAYNNNLAASVGGFVQYGDSIRLRHTGQPNDDSIMVPAILKANLTTFSDATNWPATYASISSRNDYEQGIKGKWRPYENYVYRAVVKTGSHPESGDHAYTAGTTPFTLTTPWKTINTAIPSPSYWTNPGDWIRTSHVNSYSPDGAAVEEYDVDTVYSTVKYGYSQMLPYLIAQNAQYTSVRFESFENNYNNTQLEDSVVVRYQNAIENIAHTGKRGYNLHCQTNSTYPNDSVTIVNTRDVNGKGMLLRFWARYPDPHPSYIITGTFPSIAKDLVVNTSWSSGGSATGTPRYVASSGDWQLYEYYWPNPTGTAMGVTFSIQVRYVGAQCGVTNCWLDDIRVQPIEAKVMAYVYDIRNFKVIAEMDDQNFASIFQYNGEGKLVRKLVETMQGVKTIEETQYHTPVIAR